MDEDEAEAINLARQHAPKAVRVMAEIAQQQEDVSAARDAVNSLVARGFLKSNKPTDEELHRIQQLTDAEINEVFARSHH